MLALTLTKIKDKYLLGFCKNGTEIVCVLDCHCDKDAQASIGVIGDVLGNLLEEIVGK